MYCNKCGGQVETDSKYCPFCGEKLCMGESIEKRKNRRKVIRIMAICGIVCVAGIMGHFFLNGSGRKEIVTDDHMKKQDVSIDMMAPEEETGKGVITDALEERTKSESQEEEYSEKVDSLVSYMYCGDYSDGLAWIKFKLDEKKYWACIDKEGIVQFTFDESEIQSVLPFSNGFAQIRGNEKYYVIDKVGNILSAYSINNDCKICAYGDGYTVMEEYVADFSSAKYIYTVYDKDGNAIETHENDKEISPVYYCGQGVFGFQMEPNGGYATDFYCINSGKWTHMYSNQTVHFYDEDFAICGIAYYSPETHDGNRSDVLFIDPDGKLYHFLLSQDLGWDWKGAYVKDGMCILNEIRGNCLLSYDIHSDEIIKLDSSYGDILQAEFLPEQLMFYSGVVAIPLKGADNLIYISLFDTKWNVIMDPILMGSYELSDERLIVRVNDETYVFNSLTGEKIFSLDDLGFIRMGSYSDGAAFVTSDKEKSYSRYYPRYIDMDGNLLFQKVNLDLLDYME